MKTERVFTSMEQFESHFFPVAYEKQKQDRMSTKELARYLADKYLEKIKDLFKTKPPPN